VKEQTSAFLEKSRELLDQADAILSINLHEPAARTAYLAGFHAAQALLFETSGRIFKSHSGVNGEFSRLVKDDPRVDDHIRAFLGRAYDLKAIADYETGADSHISAERAREAIEAAHRFVECIAGVAQHPTLETNVSNEAARDRLLDDIRRDDAEREQDHERGDDLER
jgi:uncharacterized protein (UPF0332 family)